MAEKDQATRLDETVRGDQLRLLFEQAPWAIITSPLAASALAIAIWDVVDGGLVVAWVVVVVCMAILRFGLMVAFKKRPEAFAVRTWERLFISTVVLAGLCWGVGGWLLLPEELAFRAVIFFFLIGMASAAVAVYAIHWVAAILTILALVLPVAVEFLLQDTAPERLMGFAAVLYVIAAYRSLRITDHFVESFHAMSHELHKAKEQAETLARTDFLTGMNNRRSFYDLCATQFKLAGRHGQDLSMILLDIDQFKGINDDYGHAIGDEVLRKLAHIVTATCRESDVAGRVGGEEFAILLPHTDAENARELAERLREQMEQSVVHVDQGDVRFTASFGVAQMATGCESLEALLSTADAAMYKAKQRGRNGVFVVTPVEPEDAPR
jgi:diguanylate cyclase (GGDEF)-like protein